MDRLRDFKPSKPNSDNFNSHLKKFKYAIANGIVIRFFSDGTIVEQYNFRSKSWQVVSNPSEYLRVMKSDGNLVSREEAEKYIAQSSR